MVDVNSSGSENVGRRMVHLRRIVCEAYARDDGLLDVEGTLYDTKPHTVELPERSVPAGEPIHQMTVRLTIDRQRTIRDASAVTVLAPHGICGDIVPAYRRLIGLRIEPGFTQTVKRMFRGAQGCTHLTELLPSIATTAFQALWGGNDSDAHKSDANGDSSTSPLGGCHALQPDSVVVRRYFSKGRRGDLKKSEPE